MSNTNGILLALLSGTVAALLTIMYDASRRGGGK